MSIVIIQGVEEKRNGIHYEVDSEAAPIGVGGMGQVFKGVCVNERTRMTRPVAIKFMYDNLPAQVIERARREASIRLRNDNLVEMLGFIETNEYTAAGEVQKHYHVVSELLDGVSLSDLLEGKTKDRDGDDVPYAVKLLQDYKNDPEHFAKIVVVNVLSGLMALHDAGYIHRDIDPSNIMVTSDGHIKLIDFGIAKQMNTLTTNDKALTVAGKFMGKPEYAAPELALGDVQHQNQTTDIYAMGILLYQCMMGHTPFEGARHEILEMQMKAKMPLDVIKNKTLKAIIAKACEKKQEMRFQTSAEMRVALESGKISAVSPKLKKSIIAAVAALVILLFGVAFYVKMQQDAKQRKYEQEQFEQQKAAFAANVNALVDEANAKAMLPFNEGENYQSLMAAYNAYSEAEQLVANDSLYNISVPDFSALKQNIKASLDSASNIFLMKAEQMGALGLSDQDSLYKAKVKDINDFLNK